MKITFVVGLLITVFLKDSSQQCFPPYASNQPERKTHADLYSGQQGFSLALLNAINKIMPNENLFFSPYSTYHALLIAYFMTGGQTESYLKKVLRLDQSQNKSDIYAAYKTDKFITQVLAKSAPYEFTNANKIYVSDAVPVRDCVVNDFPEELEKKNFKTDAESVRLSINGWVENTTHHMIKDLLPRGTIDETTDLVLVNAAYFKGIWEHKFNPDLTKQEIFYVNPSKQIMVDMMHIEETFKHDVSETLGAHILELPYKGDNISMYILLPPFTNTEDSIEATLKNLTLENFRSVVENDNLISRTVQVALPKFSLETTIELTPILESLGVGNLFKGDADFSSLTPKKISVGEGIHKARIDINEHGSQAAAATAIFSWRMMTDDLPIPFKCNRPFIYLIYNGKTHTILFTGIFRSPP
ncbi:serine protease inhibitor 88Ea-like isoform X1 [Anoplophora glabripennis]|uniref:serine protease inhibitor 88Ea-like isoform X1 n=1 Tax=Anoplophora glabripennis TaxID=217634 RepID=UPI0008735CCB|nr:serine protease inhibitor 88Ea-like isoform X1 [Anoplophora glabripennis]